MLELSCRSFIPTGIEAHHARTKSLHADNTMSSQLAEALQRQEREGRGTADVPEEDEDDNDDASETESDDGWLDEEGGRLVLAKSKIKITQLQHEA